jgi:hypothetical protein
MLSDYGAKKGLTKEKIDGTYKRSKELNTDNHRPLLLDYVIEYMKKFWDKYPRMYETDPKLKDKFLDYLKGDRIKLRKYP